MQYVKIRNTRSETQNTWRDEYEEIEKRIHTD